MADPASLNSTLHEALAEARERYVARNPESRRRHEEACAFMPGGNTRTVLFASPFPAVIASGEGCYITDVDGHHYLDLLGEFSAGIYGHSHPGIRAAIDNAVSRGLNLGGHNTIEPALARAVCDRFASIDLVRFTNSGTEANLMALCAARAATGRSKVMTFDGGYHGGVLYFGNGGSPINVPFDFVVAPYNDETEAAALIAAHGPDLAAVIVEPMLGSGGCIPASPDFLHALRKTTHEHGVVLVFDEVMTSRLSPGGLQEAYGIAPDLTTLGKYVGGGMSFGAFGGREDIMRMFDPRRRDALPHAGTFNNNVLSMSAGLVGLTEIYTPDVVRTLNDRGNTLRERLNRMCGEAAIAMQFTGRGSMLTVQFTAAPVRSPADVPGNLELRELFFLDMLMQDIWLARRGMAALSLPVGETECQRFVMAVREFIDSRRSLLSPAG
jgi:glutamate-1-semialdehyde 2,1-aminomutase